MKYDISDISPDALLKYLRKSRSDDPALTVEEVLEKHDTRLNEFTERMFGGKIPEQNVFREVASSETIDGRPEMLRMLKTMESPKVKGIVTVDVQRLSRGDLEDAGRLIKLLRYTNTLVITPERIYDVRDEDDREKFERELKKGNEYLEYFKKIQANGRLDSVASGNYIGSIPPYGFDKTSVMVGKKRCPILKENKEQADVVRMIFDMYVNQDYGYQKICNRLDELKIKPPNGEHWSPETLPDMLENVHYVGKVKWNWRKTQTIVEDSEIKKTRPKAKIGEFLIYEGKHEGIIPEELFYSAQQKKGKNPRAKATTTLSNPLAGILKCKCGKAMIMKPYSHCETRFLCNDQTHCKSGSVPCTEVYDRLCEVLNECIHNFEIRIKNNEGDSVKLHNNLIKNLKKKLKDLEERELAQWEAQASPNPADRMPQEIFRKLNEKLLKEKEEIQQALCKAYESMPEPVDYEEKIFMFKDALDALKDENVPVESKNKLLKACIDSIIYTRDTPVRIPKEKIAESGVDPREIQKGGWYTPPFLLDVKLRV